jgi:hypothetical protein
MLDLSLFFKTLLILFIGCIVLGFYLIYSYSIFFAHQFTFKTKIKPTITWELQAHGQKVDTVWIYEFK